MGLVAPPAPAFSFVETPGSPPAQVWYRCGRCCGFKSTSQSRITIMQSPSRASSLWPVGLVAPPAPAFSFVETPGSPPAQVWYRCGRCCGFKSTSLSRITIMQSQSRAHSSWPVGLVVPPAPAFSFVETPGSPPAQIWCRCGRCCGFKSTSQSRITIMQSQSRASSSWPVGLVVPPAPAFSFVETPGSPPPKFGTGVVAGSSRHRNHVSPSCNHTIKSV